MTVLVGLDIGTSSAKAVILDVDGRLLAWAGEEYTIDSPHPGWAEQDPRVWLEAALRSIGRVVESSGIPPQDVAGIGLTGQMHSLVCLGKDHQPLRPAIIWADRRSSQQVQALERSIGRDRLAELTGNRLAAGFMLASWAWLREYEPQIAAAAHCLLLPKDEVRRRLTGVIASEPSDASATLLFDPVKRAWSQPVLEAAGLSLDRLPPIVESAAVVGGLLPEIAALCGLVSGTPVIAGGSDQSMAAFSQGVIDPGVVSCTIGTGGQVFAPILKPRFDSTLRPSQSGIHLFCHALPERWHLQAATLSAGLSLRWLRDQLWPGLQYPALAEMASRVRAAQDGLFFLPHLAGERTPYMDPGVRGLFAGLDLHHGQAHLVRAVMEGVVFSLRQGLDLLLEMGVSLERLVAAGGATRHPLWLQLQADIFGRPVFPAQTQEATACGAALLAGVGVGVFSNAQAAIRQAVCPASEPVVPDAVRVQEYEKAYRQYLRLYPALVQAGLAGPGLDSDAS